MSVKRNLAANYFAQGWTALMGLVFIPGYLHSLGIEAYGLIGVFALLQAWLLLLDFGLSFVLNREMARFGAGAHDANSIRDVLRSVEIVVLAAALAVSVGVSLAANWIATHWLQASSLPVSVVREAIAVMGLVVAARLLESLYHGAMLGMQRQVPLAIAGALFASLRWGGALAVLLWIDNSLRAFFIWQALVSALAVVVFAAAVNRGLPKPAQAARFSWSTLRRLSPFAGGLLATSLLAVLLTQLDKVVLSRLLSLEAFGYYTLAGVLANALLQFVVPVTQAFYPRLTELHAGGDEPALAAAYHDGSQVISVLIAPAAMLLIVFGEQVLQLWTGDASLARNAAPLLSLLALGTLLNGFMNMPYTLQLAHGWSGLAARVNAVSVVVLVPLLLWVVPRFGAIGAAGLWVLLNAAYLTFGIGLMHRRLLPADKASWYLFDIAAPTAAAGAVAVLSRLTQPAGLQWPASIAWLAATGGVSVLAALLAAPRMRQHATLRLRGAASRGVMP